MTIIDSSCPTGQPSQRLIIDELVHLDGPAYEVFQSLVPAEAWVRLDSGEDGISITGEDGISITGDVGVGGSCAIPSTQDQ